jgi:hypothetical protein
MRFLMNEKKAGGILSPDKGVTSEKLALVSGNGR